MAKLYQWLPSTDQQALASEFRLPEPPRRRRWGQRSSPRPVLVSRLTAGVGLPAAAIAGRPAAGRAEPPAKSVLSNSPWADTLSEPGWIPCRSIRSAVKLARRVPQDK